MDNSYALSLFRQAFFLVNKALEGLKYNQSKSSVLSLTIHCTCFLPSPNLIPYPFVQVTWKMLVSSVPRVLDTRAGKQFLEDLCK